MAAGSRCIYIEDSQMRGLDLGPPLERPTLANRLVDGNKGDPSRLSAKSRIVRCHRAIQMFALRIYAY